MHVLFLSSDTGGGHRASAEALAKQFQLLFPGTTYDLLDVVEKDGVPPYNSLVSSYKHLSAHPSQWKLVYTVSNSRAFEMLADAHLKLMCERAVRKRIQSYEPDVVVSVHPLMTNVPVLSCSKISHSTGRHLPIFTVVTDLGSAHCLWFANGVEKMFVGSEQIEKLAMERGKVPPEKLIRLGLPIRHDFGQQAERLGARHSPEGLAYQTEVRQNLDLPPETCTILVMGGGEGVGSLSKIVDALYVEFVLQGIDALILVVCGRNETLKEDLANRDWDQTLRDGRARRDLMNNLALTSTCGEAATTGCIEGRGNVTSSIRRILSSGALRNAMTPAEDEKKSLEDEENHNDELPARNSLEMPGNVQVQGLGFVTRMAEYMVAADVLVTKAGPGTISEAAALGLPVMLTSFLPGQEEGNVDYVLDGGFGAFDTDPRGIAEEVAAWITEENKLQMLSEAAKRKGAPYAARDIARQIGESTLKWMELNSSNNS